jgi:hypothetical protein
MVESKTTGMLINHRNIIDAVPLRTGDVEIVRDLSYMNEEALICYQPNTEMMRVTLPEQEFVGPYLMRVAWAGYGVRLNLLNVQIFEDGTSIYDSGDIDYLSSNENVGTKIIVNFFPTSTYDIVISTGSEPTYTGTLLDYIQLDPIPSNGPLSEGPKSEYRRQEITQKGITSITGNGSATNSTTVTFPIPFDYLWGVSATSASSIYVVGASQVSNTTTTISLTHYNNSNWTGTVYVYWEAKGDIDTPMIID